MNINNPTEGLLNEEGQLKNVNQHASSPIRASRLESIRESFHSMIIGDESKKNKPFQCSLNIFSTCVGAGILNLPIVLKNFGLVIGVCLIVMCYLLMPLTVRLLAESKNMTKKYDYSTIGIAAFHKVGEIIIKVVVIVFTIGITIGYFVILGTSINKIIGDDNIGKSFFYHRQVYQILIAVLLIAVVFAKSMAKLKFSSTLSLVASFIFSIITIYNCFHNLFNKSTRPSGIAAFPSPFKIGPALESYGCIFVAFAFHFNYFPIYKSMEQATDKKMAKATMVGLTAVIIFYTATAAAGYLAYGDKTQGDFLSSFEKADVGAFPYYLVYISYICVTCCSIPLQFFEGRNFTIRIAFELIHRKKKWSIVDGKEYANENEKYLLDEQEEGEENNLNSNKPINNDLALIGPDKKEIPMHFYIIGTAIIYIFTVSVGILLTDLEIVTSFIGAVAGNAIAWLLPSIIYLKLVRMKDLQRGSIYKYGVALAIFGVFSIIISLVGVFYH